jgi:hypothetical protein
MKILLQALTAVVVAVAVCPSASAVSLEIREGRPIAKEVFVNGQGPYKFLVDTGSTLNHLDRRIAEKIGLQATFKTTLTSSTGVIPASGAAGIDVVLGSNRAENQTFLFAGLEAVQHVWPDIVGILGQDFLSNFDYLLDMRTKRFDLCDGEHQQRGTRISFRLDHGRPVISTSLGLLVVDSGAVRVVLFNAQSGTAGSTLQTVTGIVNVGTIRAALEIGEHTFWHGDAIAISQPTETAVDGMLPISVFRSVFVSNSEGYIDFE